MAENNIIVKVTGESDLTDAQLQLLELADSGKALEKQMADLNKAEEAEIKTITEMVKAQGRQDAEVKKTRDAYKAEKKELLAKINANKKNIESIKKAIKAYKDGEGANKRMSMQLREMREQLQRMEDAGEGSTDAFVKLAVEAAKLQDQIGDTQQRIAILASDTLELDAAMSAGSGLTGAFNAATSAMALFGGESEALEQAFYKVQSALSILNGLQEVSNTLNKDSAINVALSTKLTNLSAVAKAKEAVATGTATKAQKLLNAAMKMNPFGLILTAITALIGLFMAFSDKFEAFGKRLRAIADAVIGFFSKSYAAGRKAELAMKAYEKQAAATERTMNRLSIINSQRMKRIEDNERKALNASKKRHDSTIKQYQIELKYLKQREAQTIEYTNDAITANNKAIKSAKDAMDAAAGVVNVAKGEKKRKEALEKLAEAEKTYYEAVERGMDLENQRSQAKQAVAQMEQQIADERINRERQTQQALIDVMREGAEKERAQIELNYKQQLEQAGKGTELYAALEEKKNKEIQEVDRKYNAKALAEYAEQLRLESEADQFNYDKKEDYYKADAIAKVAELNKMEMSEEEYANAVLEIQQELNRNLKSLTEQRLADTTRELQRELTKAENALDGQLFGGARLDALKNRYDAQMELYKAQKAEINEQQKKGTISFQDYQDRLLEIETNRANAARDLELESLETIQDAYSKITDHLMEWFSVATDIANSAIQAQMDKLEEMYTTDAEEAAKDANKKYITEKELDAKKRQLQNRQARIAKAQAILEAGINIPLMIMKAAEEFAFPSAPGIAAVAMTTALGAAQLAAIMAKPLNQYAKGRKGGPGEMALVGEKGPEIMYVPQGASIIPNSKIDRPDTWGSYGIPQLNIPERPDISSIIGQAYGLERGTIDYDKLGKAVAANMPKFSPVSVNVDRKGVTITDGRDTRTYLNTKYQGAWN